MPARLEQAAGSRGKPAGRAWGRSVLRDGLLILGITLLLFVILEVGIRLIAPQKVDTTFINGVSFGLRDERLGHVNQPNAHTVVQTPEYEAEYKVNAQGFRDENLYTPFAAEGVTRILLLGDSFTFGSGNRYDEIWPVVLENRLRDEGHRVEVIKAGVPAYDTRVETLYLERLADVYHPDIAILAFLPNDLFTNMPFADETSTGENGQDGLQDMGVISTSDKKSSLHSVTLAIRLLMQSDDFYTRLYLMTQRREFFAVPPTDNFNRQVEVTKGLFARTREICREKDCELMVLSIPQQFQVLAASRGPIEGVDPTYIDSTFMEMAEEWDMPWIPALPDLTDAYITRGQDLYHRYDSHLTPAGNEVVGGSLADFLGDWLMQRKGVCVEQSDQPALGAPC